MKGDKCNFNQDGHCTEINEFPEMKSKPCGWNKNGLCTAEPENLVSVCPDCGYEHKTGECLDFEDALMVPAKRGSSHILDRTKTLNKEKSGFLNKKQARES